MNKDKMMKAIVFGLMVSCSAFAQEKTLVTCQDGSGRKYEVKLQVSANPNSVMPLLRETYAAGVNYAVTAYDAEIFGQKIADGKITMNFGTFLEKNATGTEKYAKGGFFRSTENNEYTDVAVTANPSGDFLDVSYVFDNGLNGRGFARLAIYRDQGTLASIGMNLFSDRIVDLQQCVWNR